MPKVITNNLDLWTSALLAKSTAGRGSNGKVEAYGIKKLRELILELAVRGKLVSQDPNDEPASELLKRIQTEKMMLIAEGKIKKDKPLPPIADEVKPFDLPNGWAYSNLGDVVEIVRGITFPGNEKSKDPADGRIACLRTTNVQDQIEWDDILYIREEFVSREDQLLKPCDIVMSMANSRELVGKVALVGEKINQKTTFGGFLGVLRPFLINPSFVMALLRTPYAREMLIDSASQTTNIANVSLAKLRPLFFAIPPLAEQHRIVAKVDELMALCDQLEQQQTDSLAAHQSLVETLLGTLTRVESQQEFSAAWVRIASHFDTLFTTEASIDQLKQTILQLAVMGKLVPQDPNDEPAETLLDRVNEAKEQLIVERKIRQSDEAELSEPRELFDVPVGWLWVHVKDVAIVQGGKRLPNGAVLLETPTSHIYIRVTDMKNGTVAETGLMYISPEVQRQISRYTINKEDLYITIAGTIGDVGVIPDALDGQNLTENAAKIVFRILDKRFFQLALSSDFVQAQFLEKTKQMAQPKLALKRIAGAKFCLPPLAEQHRIVVKVDELMGLCDTFKARLADAQVTQLHLADAIVEQAVA